MASEDITFCANSKCPIMNCIRHQRNIRNFNILHSFAVFTDCAYMQTITSMREATSEEAKSVNNYVDSISTPTETDFYTCIDNNVENEHDN